MNESFGMDRTIHTTGDLFTRNWWLVALRGVAAIIFGLLAFVWPGLTLLTLVCLYGAYALVNGILALTIAIKAPKGYPHYGSLILQAVFSIVMGVVAFVWPGITALVLLLLIAFWAIVSGIFEIVTAVRLRKVIAHEWLLVLAGALSVLFGVLLLLRPAVGALALVWWIGAFAVVFGILLLGLSFRMRHLRHAEQQSIAPA
jgi:uncharacterized membrane protein HdeD (DUF308 family)